MTARDAATLVLAVLAQADVATNRRDGRTLEKALEIANATVMPGQPEMPDLPEFCKVVNSARVRCSPMPSGGSSRICRTRRLLAAIARAGLFSLEIQRPQALASMQFGDSPGVSVLRHRQYRR